MKRVLIPYTDVEVFLPTIDFFIDKLERGENFHFLRANHGILDIFIESFSRAGRLQLKKFSKLVDEKAYDEIAEKLTGKHKKKKKSAHGKATSFDEKIKSFLRVFFDHKNLSDKFMIGVSVDVGLDTVWGRMPEIVDGKPTNLQLNREILLSFFFSRDDSYYHAGVIKHYTVMGEMNRFFDYLNGNNYTVIFLGPSYFRLFKDYFKKFVHISTPNNGAIDFYDSYIEEIKKKSVEEKIFLFHASGHIGSAYLAEKTKNEKFSAFDIGRSFDWFLKKHLETEPDVCAREECWVRNTDLRKIKRHIKNLRNE
jgi:hypothetical protein